MEEFKKTHAKSRPQEENDRLGIRLITNAYLTKRSAAYHTVKYFRCKIYTDDS